MPLGEQRRLLGYHTSSKRILCKSLTKNVHSFVYCFIYGLDRFEARL
jgi:hypothetical protein